MAGVADIVNISISVQAVTPSQPGFGEAVILAADCPAGFTQRVRHYAGPGPVALAQLVTDGFATSNATYLAVQALFEQNPSCESVAVGRLANKPTKIFTLTPTFISGATYSGHLDGVAFSAVGITDLTTTVSAIVTAMGSPADLTIANSGGTHVLITAGTAGRFHTLAIDDSSLLDMEETTADAGVAADLAAIFLADNTPYAINCDAWASAAIVELVADFTAANGKLLVTQTCDTGVANLTHGSGSDIAQTLQGDSNARAALIYAQDSNAWAGISWLGARLPTDPGSENWMFAVLVGVQPVNLTGTQIANLKAKDANYYYTAQIPGAVNGVNLAAQGRVSSGSYIDLTRGQDWLTARLQSRILGLFTTTQLKVPYTATGTAAIQGEIQAMMQEAIDAGFLTNQGAHGAPKVTALPVSQQTTADRSNRIMRGFKFQADAAGAVDEAVVTGVVLL